MADDISLMDAIYSQRQTTRYRRDPVSREDLEKIIDAAIRAPSGATPSLGTSSPSPTGT